MLAFVQKRYKKFIFNFRYYTSVISGKLKTPFAVGVIIGFFVFLIGCYYGLNILIGLVYDEEVAAIVNFKLLYILPMFLATTIYLNLVLMVKIIWERILRSPGTLLRFRIIGFFFLSILIPALLFIFVFDNFFERSVAIFDNQAILRTMENKKLILIQEVERLKRELDSDLTRQINKGFSNFLSEGLTYVGVYNQKGERIYHLKINNFSLQSVPNYSFTTLLSPGENRFTSYDVDRGFVYQLRQQIYQGQSHYFIVINRVSPYLKNDIEETFAVIRQVKQFELLLYPFKIFTIIFLIYIYSQTFSILAIIFYYSSSRYISPIAELIKATKQIIRGDYKLSLSRLTKRMSNNEIKELLESFTRMSRELFNYRSRLERISNIEAWKDVSQKLAHEIKNPLTPILLAKDQVEKYLVKNDFQGYDKMRENFLFIETEIKRILTLLDEFNILAEQKLISLQKVDSKEILLGLRRLVGNYKFIKWVGDDYFQNKVLIDKDKMMRVFFNLLRNSIESLEEMRVRHPDREFIVKVVIYSEELKVSSDDKLAKVYKNFIFEVWDNGVGIPEDKRNEIFKPYITFKKQGTGLGLAICSEIVSLHQGEIENFTFPKETRVDEKDKNGKSGNIELLPPLDNQNIEISSLNEDPDKDYWTVFRITIPYTES